MTSTSTGNLTAESFRKAFVDSYFKARRCFSPERWAAIWDFPVWTEMMLKAAPREMEQPILAEIAASLGFRYEHSEPLRLDAVFSDNPGRDFPIKVAVEHENKWRNFWCAIERLLLVRCPLKVGITYTSRVQTEECFRTICEDASKSFLLIRNIVGEESKTEYLFLVGVETLEREISWYFLEFTGTDGPENRIFLPLDQPTDQVSAVGSRLGTYANG
jgi:hypothetical protein